MSDTELTRLTEAVINLGGNRLLKWRVNRWLPATSNVGKSQSGISIQSKRGRHPSSRLTLSQFPWRRRRRRRRRRGGGHLCPPPASIQSIPVAGVCVPVSTGILSRLNIIIIIPPFSFHEEKKKWNEIKSRNISPSMLMFSSWCFRYAFHCWDEPSITRERENKINNK